MSRSTPRCSARETRETRAVRDGALGGHGRTGHRTILVAVRSDRGPDRPRARCRRDRPEPPADRVGRLPARAPPRVRTRDRLRGRVGDGGGRGPRGRGLRRRAAPARDRRRSSVQAVVRSPPPRCSPGSRSGSGRRGACPTVVRRVPGGRTRRAARTGHGFGLGLLLFCNPKALVLALTAGLAFGDATPRRSGRRGGRAVRGRRASTVAAPGVVAAAAGPACAGTPVRPAGGIERWGTVGLVGGARRAGGGPAGGRPHRPPLIRSVPPRRRLGGAEDVGSGPTTDVVCSIDDEAGTPRWVCGYAGGRRQAGRPDGLAG